MHAALPRRDFLRLAGLALGAVAPGGGRAAAATRDPLAARCAEAGTRIARQIEEGAVAAAVLLVRRDGFEFARAWGRAGLDTPFLIASPTKPMTVSAVLRLRDEGRLRLDDPVRGFLPAFTGRDREAVTVRHLLNHTSGLPDMLPENEELRKRHAPLAEFVERTCRTPLLFRPGARVGYQSMGILLAAAIVERVSGESLPAFLARRIFAPLGMGATSLGLGGRALSGMAACQVPEPSDWDWNSPYWRNLGAPWGGAHAPARDLARFAEAFAPGAGAGEPWPPATRAEMRAVQTGGHRPAYGHGWVREPGAFGRSCSPETFGHFGSTGTVVWHDPATRTTCVVLTSCPAAESKATLLVPVSELVGGPG